MTRPVHVIVVAYHAPELLERALESLRGELPVTVVDNSQDDAVQAVCERHGVTYLPTSENLGFAAGVNAGVAPLLAEPPRDILLLNPDAVITPADIESLSAALHAGERLGAVAPLLQDEAQVAERVAWPFPSPRQAWREAIGLARLLPESLEFATGAILLLRWEALCEVGLFDERFFLYAEEVDWERRAIEAGWRIEVVSGVTALHRRAGTSSDRTRQELLFYAAQETYIRKWYGARGWVVYRSAVLAGAALRSVVLRGSGRKRASRRLRLFLRGPRRMASEYA